MGAASEWNLWVWLECMVWLVYAVRRYIDFFISDQKRAFFDIKLFTSFAQSHRNTSLSQCYKKNEQEKKRTYDQRIREVEHGSFSPFVFSTSGGMGPNANVIYKK